MPNFDGTGPRGKGPMTGGGRGYCAIPLPNPGQNFDLLRNQIQILQTELKQIKTRIKEIKTKTEVHHARI